MVVREGMLVRRPTLGLPLTAKLTRAVSPIRPLDRVVELQIRVRIDDHSSVTGLEKVPSDALQGNFVSRSRLMGEPGALVYGKGNVWPRISSEVHQHSDNQSILPSLASPLNSAGVCFPFAWSRPMVAVMRSMSPVCLSSIVPFSFF